MLIFVYHPHTHTYTHAWRRTLAPISSGAAESPAVVRTMDLRPCRVSVSGVLSGPWWPRSFMEKTSGETNESSLVGGLAYLDCFSIGNVIIPTDFHIFQGGWNHQPAMFFMFNEISKFFMNGETNETKNLEMKTSGFPKWAVAAIHPCWLMISWGIILPNI